MDGMAPSASIAKKLKQNQDGLCDLTDAGTDKNLTGVPIGSKGKTKLSFNDISQDDAKDISFSDPLSGIVDSLQKTPTSGSDNSNNADQSNSLISFPVDDNSDDNYVEDVSDYDDNDEYLFEEEDDYIAMQAHFDNVDIPTGVEASLPWPKDPAPNGSQSFASITPGLFESKMQASIPDHDDSGPSETKSKAASASGSKSGDVSTSSSKSWAASTSCSAVAVELSSNVNLEESEENSAIVKFKNFKQFDTVEDFSDHHFNLLGFAEQQPPKNWGKRIQEEWKILKKDLPDTIFVRVCEGRMELLRAVIVGPSGTPYHDGLFVFDCLFPPNYPDAPPMVYYYSGGLRLNPNLYECGKVCLSLLGTWSGHQNEMWIPQKSTMLQVLVSIQALILNAKPFFNEPGYESTYRGVEGEKRSNKYNEDTFIMSLKTMIYTLRRPPKYFEDYVIGHFHACAHNILLACKAYVDHGCLVGSVVVKDGVATFDDNTLTTSREFRDQLKKIVDLLITTFSRFGSIECEQFRIAQTS